MLRCLMTICRGFSCFCSKVITFMCHVKRESHVCHLSLATLVNQQIEELVLPYLNVGYMKLLSQLSIKYDTREVYGYKNLLKVGILLFQRSIVISLLRGLCTRRKLVEYIGSITQASYCLPGFCHAFSPFMK